MNERIFFCLFLQDSDSLGFEKCYEQSVRSCKGFLHQVKENKI